MAVMESSEMPTAAGSLALSQGCKAYALSLILAPLASKLR